MPQRVLATKLHIPPWRPGNVARPHLIARLQAWPGGGAQTDRGLRASRLWEGTLMVEWVNTPDDYRRVALACLG